MKKGNELRHYFTIKGVLPDLNTALEKAKAGNVSRRAGFYANPFVAWKKKVDDAIAWEAKLQLPGVKVNKCAVAFFWFAPDRRKDPDNISHAAKYILDGLQKAGILENDGWSNTAGGFIHLFEVDPENPRVEVHLMENVKIKCSWT